LKPGSSFEAAEDRIGRLESGGVARLVHGLTLGQQLVGGADRVVGGPGPTIKAQEY
jgi:hypothetical protein